MNRSAKDGIRSSPQYGGEGAVRDDHDLDVRGADGAIQSAQVIKQPDLIGDRLDARIDLATLGQEVVAGVDKEERGSLAVVGRLGHRLPRWPPSGRLHCL